jgi:cytochrome c553
MRFAIVLLGLAATLPAQAKLTPAQVKLLPPAATRQVSFSNDIKPILEASCIKCHGRGRDKGNFRIDSRETLLKGGDSGSPVVIGKSDESLLIELVSGLDPDNVMPKKGSKLTKDQIALLRAWIDQGAKWDSEISFAKQPPRNLSPASANITVRGKANPIDAILEPYFKTNRIKSASPVSDAVFARRVYLDVMACCRRRKELDGFIADKNADKRARLVQRLLADNQRYAEHWLTFWNDALRNDYRGTGYIDGGRKQITAWLFNRARSKHALR